MTSDNEALFALIPQLQSDFPTYKGWILDVGGVFVIGTYLRTTYESQYRHFKLSVVNGELCISCYRTTAQRNGIYGWPLGDPDSYQKMLEAINHLFQPKKP